MRKINVRVTVELLIRADDDADIDDAVSEWASRSTYTGPDADVEDVAIIGEPVVTDSR
jgi:hypothetical protein